MNTKKLKIGTKLQDKHLTSCWEIIKVNHGEKLDVWYDVKGIVDSSTGRVATVVIFPSEIGSRYNVTK